MCRIFLNDITQYARNAFILSTCVVLNVHVICNIFLRSTELIVKRSRTLCRLKASVSKVINWAFCAMRMRIELHTKAQQDREPSLTMTSVQCVFSPSCEVLSNVSIHEQINLICMIGLFSQQKTQLLAFLYSLMSVYV